MRVLFDGGWWAEGPTSNRQVQRELILAWERRFPEDDIVVAVPRSARELARAELPDRVDVRGTWLWPHGVSVLVELPALARRVGADLTVAHNFTPLAGRAAVFVHDVLFVTNPEWFTRPELLYLRMITATLRRAEVVATSSKTEAARIEARTAAARPVEPIGLAMAPALAAATPRLVEELADVDGFVLVVGRLNIRKNLDTVLHAALRSDVISPRVPVVVVGEPDGRGADLSAELEAGVRSGAIRFLGYVSDEHLAWLYAGARVFVFVSLDEGFGIPMLEALHFGAPVVASDIPVFREILGTRATFVPPLDVEAVAAAIDGLGNAPRPAPVDPARLGYAWDLSATRLREAVLAAERTAV
jgi:glycosyltransferase involved in cell wall biosynthesis